MIYHFDSELIEPLLISKNKSPRNIVILFPVTRIGEWQIKKWSEVIRIIQKSQVAALILIDKTPSQEATEYFLKRTFPEEADLYIVRRPITEDIFASQRFIELESGLWILQIHDDDQWAGVLALPEDSDDHQYFEIDFFLKRRFRKHERVKGDTLSARIVFTLLPSQVWNRFAKMIREMGGRGAGSLDATLTIVTRLSAKKKTIANFSYTYDDKHWRRRLMATKHLKELTLQDGWANYTSVEIAMINRTIDGLAALYFFAELIPADSRSIAEQKLLNYFQPSGRKRKLVGIRSMAVNLILGLLKSWSWIFPELNLFPFVRKLKFTKELDSLLQNCWKVQSIEDVIAIIKNFKSSGQFPLLEKRFDYWIRQLDI